MSSSIGYFEAWRCWAGGQDIGDRELLTVPILWWGRAGKIAAFLGGATIILDLIGPERLKTWGKQKERLSYSGGQTLLLLMIAVAVLVGNPSVGIEKLPLLVRVPLSIALAVGMFGFVRLVAKIGSWLGTRFSLMLDQEKPAHGLRVFAVYLIFVGFHFDLLAS
jgi:hypothetical protein